MHLDWGIYVHVPWCRRRCPYCDFYIEVGKAEDTFADHIFTEYTARRSLWPRKQAATLYFGGGTPSVLPTQQIKALISQVDLIPTAEITLEANPEDVTKERVDEWLVAGVNRISLGIQSFDDAILKQLGRKHRAHEAWNAVRTCVQAGLRVSVDLIYGVPKENAANVHESVRQLCEERVGQISAYLLTVEDGTQLEKLIRAGRTPGTDDDHQAQAFEDLQGVMKNQGFIQYEISSFAKSGQESRHNRNYWGKGSYLGLGPSAHSMRILGDGSLERSQNVASLHLWKEGAKREAEILTPGYALLESIAFGLRDLSLGVDLANLEKKHQCSVVDEVSEVLEKAMQRGFVEKTEQRYRLTQLGVRFADGVARELLAVKA